MRPSAHAAVSGCAGQWTGPVLFSAAVHLSLAVGYVFLGDSATPPQPPSVIAVELVPLRDLPGAGEMRPVEPVLSVASAPAQPQPAPRKTPISESVPREPAETAAASHEGLEPARQEKAAEPVPAVSKAAPANEPGVIRPAVFAPPPKRKPVLTPPPIGMAEKTASSTRPASPAATLPERPAKPITGAPPSEIASAASAGAAAAKLIPPRYAAPGRGNPLPDYPRSARRRGIEGKLVLRVRVDGTGRAETIDIIESSGHGLLDDAAEQAVRQWRFEPARRYGIPVSATIDVPVVFRLRE